MKKIWYIIWHLAAEPAQVLQESNPTHVIYDIYHYIHDNEFY